MKKDILPLTCRTQRRDFSTIEPPANNLKAKEDMGEKEKAAHIWNKKTAQLDVTVAPPLSGDVRWEE